MGAFLAFGVQLRLIFREFGILAPAVLILALHIASVELQRGGSVVLLARAERANCVRMIHKERRQTSPHKGQGEVKDDRRPYAPPNYSHHWSGFKQQFFRQDPSSSVFDPRALAHVKGSERRT